MGNVVISKKFLRTRKIMVMHRNERRVGDDDGDDFPLREGSFPGRTAPPEPKIGSAKVLPRGGGGSSGKMAYDYFSIERVHIAEDGHRRATRGPTR